MFNNKGFTWVVPLLIMALSATGVVSLDKFADIFHFDSKAKQQVVVLTADLAKAKADADAVTQARAKEDADWKALEVKKQERLDTAHELVVGAGQSLEKEKTPSVAVQVAKQLVHDADQALDPIAQVRVDAMQKVVDGLNSQIAAERTEAQHSIDALTQSVVDGRVKEAALAAQAAQDAAARAVAEQKASAALDQTTKDAGALKKWAADNKTLVQKAESFGRWALVFSVLFGVVFWGLPILGKAFPALAPIAKGLHAVFAYPAHALHAAELSISKAAHAATEIKLAAETAAHASTQATLIKVATSP